MIYNLTKKTLLSQKTHIAMSFRDRLQGMIFRKFNFFDAIVFYHCSAIHTLFMLDSIDVLFLSNKNKILKNVSLCPPWKSAIICKDAYIVIELPAGTIDRTSATIGDYLYINAEITDATQESLFNHMLKGKAMFPVIRRK